MRTPSEAASRGREAFGRGEVFILPSPVDAQGKTESSQHMQEQHRREGSLENSFQDTALPRGSQVPRGYHVARWVRHSDPQPIRMYSNRRAAPGTPASVSCSRTVFVHADLPAGHRSGGARLCKRPALHPRTGSSAQKGHDGTSPSTPSWCNPPRSLEEPGCLSQSSTSHATSEG